MTAERIQAVALKCFSKKGYEGTSLAEIAAEVGIKKPSIYAHFASKKELFLSIVQLVAEEYRQYRQTLLAETEALDFEQRLYTVFQSIVTYFTCDRVKLGFWVRFWTLPPVEAREEILVPWRSMNSTFVDEIAIILEQGMSQGVIRQCNAKNLAMAYLCLLDGALMRVICYTDMGYSRHFPEIWNCFWSGSKAE